MHHLPLLLRQTVRNSRFCFKPGFAPSRRRFHRRDALQRWGRVLLRQVDITLGLTQSLAQCFHDSRQQVYVDHSVRQLLAQRLYGLALGYEDLNDHEWLRLDPLLATACEKRDPLGQDRFNPAHRGVALAGASTLNRLELSNNKSTRAPQAGA